MKLNSCIRILTVLLVTAAFLGLGAGGVVGGFVGAAIKHSSRVALVLPVQEKGLLTDRNGLVHFTRSQCSGKADIRDSRSCNIETVKTEYPGKKGVRGGIFPSGGNPDGIDEVGIGVQFFRRMIP